MTEIIGVRFKENGKVYYFDPDQTLVSQGQQVVVETSRGLELGTVAQENRQASEAEIVAPLRKLVRLADEEDIAKAAENRAKEKDAFAICQKRIAQHKLEMHLVDVEFAFDGSKILFYFTADGRIDFRELVKDLASIFRTRIELRQIGVRDEAKMLGGIGICGRAFCCSTFLNEFHPVSIKMAKEQSLSLNPAKISGTCGRLMCCLKYEQAAYEELHRTVPPVDAIVETPEGRGVVIEVTLLKKLLKVRLDKQNDGTTVVYHADDCKVIRAPRMRERDKPRDIADD